MPFGGRNSIFRKPLGTGRNSAAAAKRRAEEAAKKAAEELARKAREAAKKAAEEAERLAREADKERLRLQKETKRKLAEAAANFNREIVRASEAISHAASTAIGDIEQTAANAQEGLSRTMVRATEDFGRELTWVKEDLENEAASIKNQLDDEATHLKNRIDKGATKAKANIDKELTRTKGKIDAEATKLKRDIDREAENSKANIDRELANYKADIDRELTKLKADVERELQQAKNDIDDAVDAASVFLQTQAKSLGDTLSETEALAREGKITDALWHVAAEPYNDSKEGFVKAVSTSSLLNQAASTAVAVYGSPAATAAYSAWLTYEMTGDFEASIKAGVIAGVSARAGKAIDGMKVDTVSEAIKKSIMRGAVNAGAIAASGGSQEDIEAAFITSASSTAQKESMVLMKKWVKTEVTPYFSDFSEPDINVPESVSLVETAKSLYSSMSDFKTQFEEATDVGNQLQTVILNSTQGALHTNQKATKA